MDKATITKYDRFRGGNIEWAITLPANRVFNERDAISAQMEAGYPPAGYGFYRFRSVPLENGTVKYTWASSNCCD